MRSISKARLSLAFVPYGVVGVVHVAALAAIALGADASALVTATKPLLMPLLLLGFLLGVPAWRAGAARLGGAAIVLSWVGDVALMLPGDTAFLVGLGAFLGAHVCFVLLISRHLTLRRLPLASLAYLGWWIALVALLAPHVSWLVWPLAAYGVVLGLMAALATRARAAVAVGGLLFLVSDTVLAVSRFAPGITIWQSDVLIMLTYIAGQGLIAVGAVLHLRRVNALAGPEGEPAGSAGVVPVIRTEALH